MFEIENGQLSFKTDIQRSQYQCSNRSEKKQGLAYVVGKIEKEPKTSPLTKSISSADNDFTWLATMPISARFNLSCKNGNIFV